MHYMIADYGRYKQETHQKMR